MVLWYGHVDRCPTTLGQTSEASLMPMGLREIKKRWCAGTKWLAECPTTEPAKAGKWGGAWKRQAFTTSSAVDFCSFYWSGAGTVQGQRCCCCWLRTGVADGWIPSVWKKNTPEKTLQLSCCVGTHANRPQLNNNKTKQNKQTKNKNKKTKRKRRRKKRKRRRRRWRCVSERSQKYHKWTGKDTAISTPCVNSRKNTTTTKWIKSIWREKNKQTKPQKHQVQDIINQQTMKWIKLIWRDKT